MMYHNYEFKNLKYKKLWEYELQNTITNMQIHYKNNLSMNKVLSIFKKVFHITPVTLKTDKSSKMKYLRTLVFYILIHYSYVSKEKIAQEFQISLNDLEDFENTESISTKILTDTKTFFEYIKEDYLSERKNVLAFQDEISFHFDTK